MTPLLEMVRDRFRVRTYPMSELTPAQAAFVRAGQIVGLPYADDLDSLEAGVGVGPMAANVVDGTRWNSAFAFLDPVRDNQLLHIASDFLVDRLIIEHGVVTGVIAIKDGVRSTVRAARVVLCAGAYGSPAILLRSGIGPAADLKRLGIPLVVDLPGVGANLLDHPCTQMDFRGSPRIRGFADLRRLVSRRTVRRTGSIVTLRRRAVRHPRLRGRRRQLRTPQPPSDLDLRRRDEGDVRRAR